jgi:hypothetical protein
LAAHIDLALRVRLAETAADAPLLTVMLGIERAIKIQIGIH